MSPQEAQDGDLQIVGAESLDRAALQILRGVGRYFRALDLTIIAELPLADGRRADLMALDPRGGIRIVEIKSCTADFRSGRNTGNGATASILPSTRHSQANSFQTIAASSSPTVSGPI